MENDYPNLSTVSASEKQTVCSALQFLQSLLLSNLTVKNLNQSLKNIIEVIAEFFCADNGYILLEGNMTRPASVAAEHLEKSKICRLLR